jgi:UDP-N-acetylmuramate: L-alanyl-gamma-D-glutamyl-meso-diaminopimelate ligase
VIGNVISAENPEAKAAFENGYATFSLPEVMGILFLKNTRNLVVAGTHGKTTTSSLLAHVLKELGTDPSFFIGGVPLDLPYSFHVSSLEKGSYFVLEGDEYDTAFWDKVPKFNHYLPDDVILTSVEYDHADIYPDFESVIKVFQGLMTRIRSGGRLIACLDDPCVKDLLLSVSHTISVTTYGGRSNSLARFTVGNVHSESELTHFSVLENQSIIEELTLQVPGMHNILNALSVWILVRDLGFEPKFLKKALRSFRGVKRRQELRGEEGGVRVIDDFAHHPTAVRETLNALRLRYPKMRIVAVFEPRSATSRRKVFQLEYTKSFHAADLIFVAPPYDQSRIPVQDRFSSEELLQALVKNNKKAFLLKPGEEGIHQVALFCQKNDLLVVLSNGGFGGFIQKILKILKK